MSDQIKQALSIINPDGVFEIRAFDWPKSARYTVKTISGYFDDHDKATAAIARLNKTTTVYMTVNPVDPMLLARASNRLVEKPKSTTSDNDILSRQWLLIDTDPKRPSGISATDAQLSDALAVRDAVAAELAGHGMTPAIVAMSGNGGHLMYKIDLPNDDQTRDAIDNLLKALNGSFGSDAVSVDETVYNAARIWKIYGTHARKGDPLPDLPHRLATIDQHNPDAETVTIDQIISATDTPTPTARPVVTATEKRPFSGGQPIMATDIDAALSNLGIDYTKKDSKGKTVWKLDRCLTSDAHTDGAAVTLQGGVPGYKCHHDGCNGQGMKGDVYRLLFPDRIGNKSNGGMYFIHNGAIYRSGKTVQKVADFTATVSRELRELDGTVTFTIKGEGVNGRVFSFDILAKDYADRRALTAAFTAHAGAKNAIQASGAAHLAPAMGELSPDHPTETLFTKTGWVDGRFIIHGIDGEGVIRMGKKAPYSVKVPRDGGEIDRAVKALDALLNVFVNGASVVISSALNAPLLRLTGMENERSACMLIGQTGSFKTTFAQLVMSIYGAGFLEDKNLLKLGEGATPKAMMTYASSAHDMPFMIDNYKPNSTPYAAQQFVGMIHNILEGGDRERLNSDSKLQESSDIFCSPIITGETAPDTDASTIARMLLVDMPVISSDHLSTVQEIQGDLELFGGYWLNWLQNNREIATKIVKKQFKLYREFFEGQISESPNSWRMATNIALNLMPFQILQHESHPEPIRAMAGHVAHKHEQLLVETIKKMGRAAHDSSESQRFVDHINSLIETRQGIILQRSGARQALVEDAMGDGITFSQAQIDRAEKVADMLMNKAIGYTGDNDNKVYIRVPLAKARIKSVYGDDLNGLSNKSLYSLLEREGRVWERGDKSLTKLIRVDTGNVRVIALNL